MKLYVLAEKNMGYVYLVVSTGIIVLGLLMLLSLRENQTF